MPIQNEKFSLLVSDSSGNPLTGALVELRKDATIYTTTEVGNGWYSIASIPTGKYSVFVDSVDTGETKAVGSGQVAALGNETDNVPVSTSTEYGFQDSTALKTTLSLENVTNVAVPNPTASDANKVIKVDSNGDYELGSISTSGYETIFEVQTTAELIEALSAEYDAKLLVITREDFNFVNAQSFEVWGSCSIIIANTFEPFQWQSNSVNVAFDYKAGADVGLTGMQFLNGVIAFGSPADYTLNVPWKVTNLDFIGSDVSRSVNGSSTLVYENALSTIPASVVVSTSQDWWQNSASDKLDSVVAGTNVTIDNTDPQNPIINASGGGSQDLESVLTQGNTTGANSIQFEDTATPNYTFGQIQRNGDFLELPPKTIIRSDLTTGTAILQAFFNNSGDSIIGLPYYDETTNKWQVRTGGANARDIVFTNGITDSLRLVNTVGGTIEIHTEDAELIYDNIPTGSQVGLVGYDANGKLIQGTASQDLESVLTQGSTSTLGATFGGDLIVSGTTVNFANIPTSSAGLSAGDLWNDSGTLKIV